MGEERSRIRLKTANVFFQMCPNFFMERGVLVNVLLSKVGASTLTSVCIFSNSAGIENIQCSWKIIYTNTIIARGLSSLTGDVVLCVLLYLILKQGRENVGFIPIYGVVWLSLENDFSNWKRTKSNFTTHLCEKQNRTKNYQRPVTTSFSTTAKIENSKSRRWFQRVKYEWLRQNFYILHQYNIKQKSDENKLKYQLGDN